MKECAGSADRTQVCLHAKRTRFRSIYHARPSIIILIWLKYYWKGHKTVKSIWATSRENLSSGFATRWDSNRPAQLMRLARVLKFRLDQVYPPMSGVRNDNIHHLHRSSRGNILSRQQTTNMLIRLRECTGWSAPLLLAYGINRFSHDMAQMYPISIHVNPSNWFLYSQFYISFACKLTDNQ